MNTNMENNVHCPITEDCPVYRYNVNHNEIVGLTYRRLYCLQGNKKFKACKRYQACVKFGKQVTHTILPNSLMSLEEIANYSGMQ
jgi:hypothetical protein